MNLDEAKQILKNNNYILDEADISGNWAKTVLERLNAIKDKYNLLFFTDSKSKNVIHITDYNKTHDFGYIITDAGGFGGEFEQMAVLIKNGKKEFLENGTYTAEEVFNAFKDEIDAYYKNESSNPSFDAAASLLAENYLLNEDSSDFLPEPDPEVEKAILSNMNADDSRSYGPRAAYDAAYRIASEKYPDLDIPSNPVEYEEVYGYDPDDPPREVIDRIFG